MVKDGSKTLTYRIGDKYDFLQVGDRIKVRDSSTDEIFEEIEIIQKSTIEFVDLSIDREGHEEYSSKEEQRKIFETYYGKVGDNDRVVVLGFRLPKS